MRRVPLQFGPRPGLVGVRELSGRVEAAVSGIGTADAVRLLDGLLVEAARTGAGPGTAAQLVSADRDRLLATVYLATYGPRVESTVTCSECEARFDVDFDLEELIASLGATPPGGRLPAPGASVPESVRRRDDGTFALPDGRAFRLPTGEDEMAVAGSPPGEAGAELLRRCFEGGDTEESDPAIANAVQSAMESLAPVVDAEVEGRCPECGGTERLRFDLQRYLLAALLRERGRLVEEIHALATAYGWSLAEILDLPRSQRRALVGLVERHPARRRGRIPA